VLQAVRTIGET